jgi:membrane associated rhomboid family serine protease
VTYVYPEDRPPRPHFSWRALSRSTQLAVVLGASYVVQVVVSLITNTDTMTRILGLWLEPLDWRVAPRLVTYAFVHNLASPLHVVLNAVALYFFGSVVESDRGPRTVLFHFFVGVVVGGVAFGILELARGGEVLPLIGASAGVYALIAASAVTNPNLETIFRIPLWVIAAIYVGMDLVAFATSLRFAGGSSTVAYVAHLAGAGAGLVLGLRRISDARLELSWLGTARQRMGSWVRRRRERREEDHSRRLDEILQKIHDQGLPSLTESEKRFLKSAPKRMGEGGERRQSGA